MKIKELIIIGAIGATALTLNSCSDFLEVESLNEIVLDKFWNEESDVENVSLGCYSALQSKTIIDRMMAWGEFRSDNIVAGVNTENDVNLVNMLKENISANNTFCTWGEFYDVINRCNTVIYYAPQVAERDPNYTHSEVLATKAEMSALRDLCYFYLIRAFRDVPFTTEAYLDDTQMMDLPATPFYDVLDSLIADLESVRTYAVKKYPVTNSYAQVGRITQDAIHAMLCEMYLWRKDYANAVKYADMVIDAKTTEYQLYLEKLGSLVGESDKMIDGFPLISDFTSSLNYYGNAYTEIFGNGCSTESIFELVYMDDDTYLANGAVSERYGNATDFPGLVKPSDFLGQDVSAEQYSVFRDKFDTRYYESIQEVSSSLYGISKYTFPMISLTLSGSKIETNSMTAYSKDYCRANWVLYRLSDVMLLKAEALTQMVTGTEEGGLTESDESLLQEALAIVNAVNKRSYCGSTYVPFEYSAYSSKAMMENLVFEERQRELMFEGKRWFDLVRRSMRDGNTNYLVTAVIRKGADNASVVRSKLAKMDGLFWPYHEDELKVNANLVQNPAYGSSDSSTSAK